MRRSTSQQSKGDGTAPPAVCSVRSRSKSGPRSRATTIPPSTSEWPPRYSAATWRAHAAAHLGGAAEGLGGGGHDHVVGEPVRRREGRPCRGVLDHPREVV